LLALILRMPEFGNLSREQAAALAGLAPFVACARKLLVFANTVIARGTPWTERPAAA
jgi:transposase